MSLGGDVNGGDRIFETFGGPITATGLRTKTFSAVRSESRSGDDGGEISHK